MRTLFVARRRFDPTAVDRWDRYVAWSGLSQLQEVVSLDTMLCPALPEELIPSDWDHNVHADYLTFFFRSLEYLQNRIAGDCSVNILAVLQNPTAAELSDITLPGFAFCGFDLVDVHGDISALTNCGGFAGVFNNEELSELGLFTGLDRAMDVRAALRLHYPEEPHAECDIWAIWRRPSHD